MHCAVCTEYLSRIEPVVIVVQAGNAFQGTHNGLSESFSYSGLIVHVLWQKQTETTSDDYIYNFFLKTWLKYTWKRVILSNQTIQFAMHYGSIYSKQQIGYFSSSTI